MFTGVNGLCHHHANTAQRKLVALLPDFILISTKSTAEWEVFQQGLLENQDILSGWLTKKILFLSPCGFYLYGYFGCMCLLHKTGVTTFFFAKIKVNPSQVSGSTLLSGSTQFVLPEQTPHSPSVSLLWLKSFPSCCPFSIKTGKTSNPFGLYLDLAVSTKHTWKHTALRLVLPLLF